MKQGCFWLLALSAWTLFSCGKKPTVIDSNGRDISNRENLISSDGIEFYLEKGDSGYVEINLENSKCTKSIERRVKFPENVSFILPEEVYLNSGNVGDSFVSMNLRTTTLSFVKCIYERWTNKFQFSFCTHDDVKVTTDNIDQIKSNPNNILIDTHEREDWEIEAYQGEYVDIKVDTRENQCSYSVEAYLELDMI